MFDTDLSCVVALPFLVSAARAPTRDAVTNILSLLGVKISIHLMSLGTGATHCLSHSLWNPAKFMFAWPTISNWAEETECAIRRVSPSGIASEANE